MNVLNYFVESDSAGGEFLINGKWHNPLFGRDTIQHIIDEGIPKSKEKEMKAKGIVWQYKNSPERGITWAAEITIIGGGISVCCYGQKQMKSAITAVNKIAKKLGWILIEPFEKVK